MSMRCSPLLKKMRRRILFETDDLVFQKNKIHSILGENGVGKTTFMRILAGLESVDSGEMYFENTPINKSTIAQCGIVYSGSNPYMLNKTVFDNIAYPLRLKHTPSFTINEKVNDCLELFQLTHLRDQCSQNLSAGEKQKVALGRALIAQPNVLLLDEPTSNIDITAVSIIESLLCDYARQDNNTLILVTHNHEQSKRMAHEEWIIKENRLWHF